MKEIRREEARVRQHHHAVSVHVRVSASLKGLGSDLSIIIVTREMVSKGAEYMHILVPGDFYH